MLLPVPIIWLYYFELGCAAYPALPQLTLIVSLTCELSHSENCNMVVLTHYRFRKVDSPRNLLSTTPIDVPIFYES
jgi:hypothetical protein